MTCRSTCTGSEASFSSVSSVQSLSSASSDGGPVRHRQGGPIAEQRKRILVLLVLMAALMAIQMNVMLIFALEDLDLRGGKRIGTRKRKRPHDWDETLVQLRAHCRNAEPDELRSGISFDCLVVYSTRSLRNSTVASTALCGAIATAQVIGRVSSVIHCIVAPAAGNCWSESRSYEYAISVPCRGVLRAMLLTLTFGEDILQCMMSNTQRPT